MRVMLVFAQVSSPCVIDGPINGQSFLAHVEQLLVPTLSPGDIVIIDNLGSHKGKAVRLIADAPLGRWRTLTFLAALRA